MNIEELKKIGIYPVGLETKQVDIKATVAETYREPPHPFAPLASANDNSFVIGGIADKVASSCAVGFAEFTTDAGRDTQKIESLKTFLNSIDQYTLFLELFVFGNSFFEIIKGEGKQSDVVYSEHMLADTIRIATKKVDDETGPYSYVQRYKGSEETFLYNEVLHFKTNNLTDKYYGKSKFYRCIDQVYLLGSIDKFYTRLIDKGNIRTKVFLDKAGKLNAQQKQAISTIISEAVSGLDNSFKSVIIPGELEALNLEDDTETVAFLDYRRDLIKSICMGCSFPYDMLISDTSNRSTSEVSKEQLNETIVEPMQKLVLQQLKKHIKLLGIRDDEIIDMILFKPSNTGNEKEKMEIITGYKKSGIIDANEARELSPYNLDERDDGNILSVSTTQGGKQFSEIEKTIKNLYTPQFLAKYQNMCKQCETPIKKYIDGYKDNFDDPNVEKLAVELEKALVKLNDDILQQEIVSQLGAEYIQKTTFFEEIAGLLEKIYLYGQGLGLALVRDETKEIEALAGLDFDLSFDISPQRALEYAQKKGGELVSNVSQMTKEQVSKIVTQSIKDGRTQNKLTQEIYTKFGQFNQVRSQLIARQETALALGGGKYDQFIQSAKNYMTPGYKKAYTTEDENVRPEHQENADAGRIPANEQFPGTGSMHEPFGYNCRCVVTYRVFLPSDL